MATKRQKCGKWEYTVRRKKLLPRPLYLRFSTEEEGDEYVQRLEALLNHGIVPPEFSARQVELKTLADAIDAYQRAVHVPPSDAAQIALIRGKVGGEHLLKLNYPWAESWVLRMKRVENLAPSTIRHYVGALARCLDWLVRRSPQLLPFNPLRLLPKRYATYSEDDRRALVTGSKGVVRADVPRDRRLAPGEEKMIRRILGGEKPKGRERALALRYQPALEMLFDLALESGMRLREMYTLVVTQVDLKKRTIFLEKTQNGDKRQVPLTSIAVTRLRAYMDAVSAGDERMIGWKLDGGRLFPWWDGDAKTLKKTTSMLSQQFGRIFDAAGAAGLNFQDLRHEAACRYYERTTLTDLQIQKIFGWKDPRMAQRYANLRGSDLARRLW